MVFCIDSTDSLLYCLFIKSSCCSLLEFLTLCLTSQCTTWLIPVLLSGFACYLWSTYLASCKDPDSKLPLPPGSMGLPIVGETINLLMKVSTLNIFWFCWGVFIPIFLRLWGVNWYFVLIFHTVCILCNYRLLNFTFTIS